MHGKTTIKHIPAKYKQNYYSSLAEMIEDIMNFSSTFPSLNI